MNVLEQLAPRSDGLSQLQALLASGQRPGILDTLDYQLTEIESGRAVFTATPSERAYNPSGAVHGGYTATLLDSACGFATLSRLSSEQAFTTLDLRCSYLKAMTRETGEVRCEGRVTSIGRRAAFAEATLTDSAGKIIATATSTLLVFERR